MTSNLTTNLDHLEINSKLSKTWKVSGKHQVVYTGGHIVYSRDNTHMICIHGEDPTSIIFYRLHSGQIVHTIDCGDDDPISTFTLSPSQLLLYTAHIRSSLIKVWNIETKEMVISFKSEHKNDIVSLELDPTGTLLASGSLDQSVRIRYSNNGHLTHHFQRHGSAITTLLWHPNVDKLLLAVGTLNGTIRIHWLGEGSTNDNTTTNNTKNNNIMNDTTISTTPTFIDLQRQDYDGTPNKSHFNKITSLSWSQCQTKLVSVGYDKMWRVWDFVSEYNLHLQQTKLPIRSHDLITQLQPQYGLHVIEIANYLALDELECVRLIPYGCSVPIRKKDSTEYVTKVLEEDNNGAIYFITTGQKGVTTIWKLSYDYINKKKAIGIVFKHTSLQSYTSQSIPFDNIDYITKLYAITPQSPTKTNNHDENDVFQTPIHLQWHKLSVYIPPTILKLQQPMTNKVITLKDGRTITKPIPTKDIILPQLPLLDSDKEYQSKLLDEYKFYEGQEMLQKENNYRKDAKELLKFQNNDNVVNDNDNNNDEKTNDNNGDMNDNDENDQKTQPEDDTNNNNEEESEEIEKQRQLRELSSKLLQFRGGEPSTTTQIMLLNGDHNLYQFNLSTFDIMKTFSLYSLQINDVKIIPNTRCVVVATNSSQLRIYNIDTLNCFILYPHDDIIVSVAVSLCGRFIMSSTTKGQIFVWVIYHYDHNGFIPLPIDSSLDIDDEDNNNTNNNENNQNNNNNKKPLPFDEKRLATHISAHIVAELKGHIEAPSALAFSHNASPSFEQKLISTNNTTTNRIDNPIPQLSKYIQVPTVHNYNRLILFACTGGSDKTVKTWNLSSLYIFVDPTLYITWSQCVQYYKSVLFTPQITTTNDSTTTQQSQPITKITKETVITMKQPEKHIFVQLSDRSIINASYILFHDLLSSSTTVPTTTSTMNDSNTTIDYIEPPRRIIFTPITTTLAHEKDINSITIHPNNNLLLTTSEDKTCKLWKYSSSNTLATSLQLMGVLKGHRRTVWQAIFTPKEKFIITVSGDKLIKIWSLSDLTCIQTLQGHTAPIVQINWLRYGLQFMTGDSNGIIRLWNLYDNNNGECISVCDEPHEGRINGLDIDHYRNDSFMVTGDTNSLLVFWSDITLYNEMLSKQQEQTTMLLNQLLDNALQHKDYLKSFELALKLNHPRQLYTIVSAIIDNEQRYKRWKALKIQRDKNKLILRQYKIKQAQLKGDYNYNPDNDPEIIGQDELYLTIEARENLELRVPKPKITIKKLISIRTIIELESLINIIIDWNTNSKFAYIAQFILHTILTTLEPDIIITIPHFKEKIDIFISYSQRHYTRTTNLLQSSYLVDHVLSNMNIYMPLHEQERSQSILQQQQLFQDNAMLFNDNDGIINAADWLLSNDNQQQQSTLQHVLSLNVDDSLLQYEIISDDDDGLGAIGNNNKTLTQKHIGQGKHYQFGKKNSNINYYYGSHIKDPFVSTTTTTSSDDDSDSDDDDEHKVELKSFGDWDTFDNNNNQLVQLNDNNNNNNNNTKMQSKNKMLQNNNNTTMNSNDDNNDMPSFGFDATWGSFDDDWEALAKENEDKQLLLSKEDNVNVGNDHVKNTNNTNNNKSTKIKPITTTTQTKDKSKQSQPQPSQSKSQPKSKQSQPQQQQQPQQSKTPTITTPSSSTTTKGQNKPQSTTKSTQQQSTTISTTPTTTIASDTTIDNGVNNKKRKQIPKGKK